MLLLLPFALLLFCLAMEEVLIIPNRLTLCRQKSKLSIDVMLISRALIGMMLTRMPRSL